MSIAFQTTSGDSIHSSRFIRHHRMSPYFLTGCAGERRFPAAESGRRRKKKGSDSDSDLSSSSSSSSIGKDSDEEEDCGGEFEAQSSFKGPLDTMDALEEVLPIKKGISKFYNGKSKSFTSLADASSAPSVKAFAKPENPYNRKRKNVLARNVVCDDRNLNHLSKDNESCMSKRPTMFNRGTLALGSIMDCHKSYNKEESQAMSSLPPRHPHAKTSHIHEPCLPPHQRKSNWRSFSLSDLQCAVAAATSNDRG
ncbi:protein OXIDATIVE STRESS 3 LIKE 2-like [Mercurialis annua]|uniref:protein OXIDATIVE STRESS 3 LIKE 2-like n=1 Tax=Mercurialis annua TaxID=3986 RepID=UPI00215FA16F|nr:protein OXIDATIVE STRESS 3 LIKE 2-like [Mercurialis annua]